MTPLPSLTYCLSRHTLSGHDSAIRLARQGGEGCDQAATLCELAALRASHGRSGQPDSAEEVTLRVLAVVLRWRAGGREDGAERAASAARHAERLIARSEIAR